MSLRTIRSPFNACGPRVLVNRGRAPRTIRLKPAQALARIKRAAAEVYDYLRVSGAPCPARARLYVDCGLVRKHRSCGDLRAYFHVGHRAKWTVCAAHEAGYLPDTHLYGLVLHEFGHPMAWDFWGRSRQQDADRAIFETVGVPILYKSGLILQWITPADVQSIKSAH